MTELTLTPGVGGHRQSNHYGNWVPLYLEPVPGSGERICIGVAASDSTAAVVVAVTDLARFSCVYGQAASALSWAAELAITEATQQVQKGGLTALHEIARRFEGLTVGPERRGAGTALPDLAQLALRQVSALSALETYPHDEDAVSAISLDSTNYLDAKVRRLVIERRPQLRENFGKTFARSQSSRPLRYGFVGKFIAANFATLHANASPAVSGKVDRAKARLWDLHQLDAGVLADSLGLKAESMSYELLVHRPRDESSRLPAPLRSALKAAEEELEAEADKFDIRFRPLGSPAEIANYLVQREAA
jgi:hypothetical protein